MSSTETVTPPSIRETKTASNKTGDGPADVTEREPLKA
uniref:Uncharacterized protein n=1 Tax=Anguilla anguilla TaxID=7936 RepID=A0A0E9US22_ANGAN